MAKRYISGRGDQQYKMRMPAGLHDRIKAAAAMGGQSMSTAIIMTLEQAFPAPIEPETVNDGLLTAAKDVAVQWAALLSAIGQDPAKNDALSTLLEKLDDAEVVDNGEN